MATLLSRDYFARGSYRDIEELMRERGIAVDHSTIYRWVRRRSQVIYESPA